MKQNEPPPSLHNPQSLKFIFIGGVQRYTMGLQIFQNAGFQIRGGLINNEPYFALVDICNAIDLQPSRVKDRLKQDGVTTGKVIDSLGREQNATLINEQNLYKVIFQSRKEEAEQFQDWVTDECLQNQNSLSEHPL